MPTTASDATIGGRPCGRPTTRACDRPGRQRLLVLACSATKSDAPDRIRAIDRYQGPLWQTLRAALPGSPPTRIAFLSAQFGFGEATFVSLPAYDAVMSDAKMRAMIEGGVATRWPRPPRAGLPDTFGRCAAEEAESMSLKGAFDDVALVGGYRYLAVMRSLVAAFAPHGWTTPDVRIAEINGPIGTMRRAMRTWIAGRRTEPPTPPLARDAADAVATMRGGAGSAPSTP